MCIESVIPESEIDLVELAAFIRARAPHELLERHRGFVDTVLCGILLMQGCDHRKSIEALAGVSFATVKARMSRILEDTLSSVWYFAMLDDVSRGWRQV